MMAQVLEEREIGTRVLPPIAVSQGALGQLDLQGVDVVCLSYLHPEPQVYARYICRRLRRRAPHIKLIVCCWNLAPGTGQTDDLKRQMAADAVFASLEACVEQVEAWVYRPPSSGETPPALPDSEQAQLAALHDLGLASVKGRQFDEVSGKVAQAFNTPIALVSFVDEVHRPPPDAAVATDETQVTQPAPYQESLDAHVIAANEVLVSEDVTEDPRFADDARVLEKGIRFYAGAPLRTSSGLVIGTLCVIDTQPREFPEPDCRRLQEMADELMSQIERRSAEGMGKAQPHFVTLAGRT
jgi:GAF domain-containing protein